MVAQKNFCILGGDFRQIYLAKKFHDCNNKVFLYGLDKLKQKNEFVCPENLREAISKSDYIILPLPSTRNGLHLNAPFSEKNIFFDKEILSLLSKKIVFGDLYKFVNNANNYTCYDYSKNEEFQIMNAVPTAEGALKTALNLKNQTFFKSKCLICGFGRIGKVLADRLKNFNASITVTDRNDISLVWADTLGYSATPINKISDKLQNYDFIFNTIPHVIFNETALSICSKNTLILDLASAPGGVDKKAAERFNINYRHELSIPGRMFPESAANIIYYSIQKIIEEKNL